MQNFLCYNFNFNKYTWMSHKTCEKQRLKLKWVRAGNHGNVRKRHDTEYSKPLNINNTGMDESFQDYSWIQDFEADFPQKISLKMLN